MDFKTRHSKFYNKLKQSVKEYFQIVILGEKGLYDIYTYQGEKILFIQKTNK